MSGGCGYADAQDQQMCMGDVVATSSRTSLVFVPPGPPAPFALAKRARVSPVPLPLPPTLDPRGPPRHSTVVPRHSPFEWRPDQGALDEWWMRPLLLFSGQYLLFYLLFYLYQKIFTCKIKLANQNQMFPQGNSLQKVSRMF